MIRIECECGYHLDVIGVKTELNEDGNPVSRIRVIGCPRCIWKAREDQREEDRRRYGEKLG